MTLDNFIKTETSPNISDVEVRKLGDLIDKFLIVHPQHGNPTQGDIMVLLQEIEPDLFVTLRFNHAIENDKAIEQFEHWLEIVNSKIFGKDSSCKISLIPIIGISGKDKNVHFKVLINSNVPTDDFKLDELLSEVWFDLNNISEADGSLGDKLEIEFSSIECGNVYQLILWYDDWYYYGLNFLLLESVNPKLLSMLTLYKLTCNSANS
jgi:hypothetical protein